MQKHDEHLAVATSERPTEFQSPLTDALVKSIAYAGSDAAQAVKDAGGKHWEQWEAGANARFDAFRKMALHARKMESERARLIKFVRHCSKLSTVAPYQDAEQILKELGE